MLAKKTENLSDSKVWGMQLWVRPGCFLTLAAFSVLRLYLGTHVDREAATPAVCVVSSVIRRLRRVNAEGIHSFALRPIFHA